MILQLFTLLGALGMFLFGMNLMSSGLQKTAGGRMRAILGSMTSNRFKSVFTGLGITSVIQSSSATTVMVVGFVNAGLLALEQAIGVIMGANIGTTVTAWLISLLGFKADISIFAVPLMAVGFLLSISKLEKRRNVSEFIIGFSLLFLGLSLMKNSVPDLQETPEVLSFIKTWSNFGFASVLIFLLFGTVLTLVLQSSSATMALTLIMLNLGWLPFDMAAAMVLGENIGTTITANIAAAVANVNARRAALAHTLFNLFGVVWALILFRPFTSLIGLVIEAMGYPNPMTIASNASEVLAGDASISALYGLSMLHTLFNTFNTLILIWFVPQIAKVVSMAIKSKGDKDEDAIHLKFIDAGPMGTAELAIDQAKNETIHFAKILRNELGYIKSAIHATTEADFEFYRGKLIKYEEISDRIEYEIASFLNSLPQDSISENTRAQSKALFKIIGEMESLGDSGEAISRILSRRNEHGKRFTDKNVEQIDKMLQLLDNTYVIMIANLEKGFDGKADVKLAVEAEVELNDMRNRLREEEVRNIEEGNESYTSSVYYIDLISEIERMGDYVINISQAL